VHVRVLVRRNSSAVFVIVRFVHVRHDSNAVLVDVAVPVRHDSGVRRIAR